MTAINRPRRRASLVLRLLLVLAAAAGAGDRPAWVAQRPLDPDYYIGIGVAPATRNAAAARDQGLKSALNDIATQIQVSVASSITQSTRETGAGISHDYTAQINTMVSTELAGVEIVSTWTGDGSTWVYARLSRAAFAAARQARIDGVRDRIAELCRQAEAQSPAAAGAAVALYLRAQAALPEALGDPLMSPSADGSQGSLVAQVPLRLRALLGRLQIRVDAVPVAVKNSAAVNLPLTFHVELAQPGGRPLPVNDFPLEVGFVRGAGEVVAQVRTSADGVATAQLLRVTGREAVQLVRGRADLASLAAGDTGATWADLAVPEATVQLQVAHPRVWLRARETNLGNPMAAPQLGPVVKELLLASGLDIADNEAAADIIVELTGDTRPGGNLDTIHFAFADVTVAVIRRADGTEVGRAALPPVKGAGSSFEQAGFKAYGQAAKQLRAGALAQILAGL